MSESNNDDNVNEQLHAQSESTSAEPVDADDSHSNVVADIATGGGGSAPAAAPVARTNDDEQAVLEGSTGLEAGSRTSTTSALPGSSSAPGQGDAATTAGGAATSADISASSRPVVLSTATATEQAADRASVQDGPVRLSTASILSGASVASRSPTRSCAEATPFNEDATSARRSAAASDRDTPEVIEEGEFSISTSGRVSRFIRSARHPPLRDAELRALVQRVDNVVRDWKVAAQHAYSDPDRLRRAQAALQSVTLHVSVLDTEFEANIRQRQQINQELTTAVQELSHILRSSDSTSAFHDTQSQYRDRLSNQLAGATVELVRILGTHAEVIRLRDRTREVYSESLGETRALVAASSVVGNTATPRTLPVTSPTPGASLTRSPYFTTAPTTNTLQDFNNINATTVAPRNTVPTRPTDPIDAGVSETSSEKGASSGPRLRLPQWKDMTNIRTKLRQFSQAVSGYSTAVKRQYLCQILPTDQIIMVTTTHPDGSSSLVDVSTLSYPKMIEALRSKFDTVMDRENARTQLHALRMKAPEGVTAVC